MTKLVTDLIAYLKAVFVETWNKVFTLFDILGIALFFYPTLANSLIGNESLVRTIGGLIFFSSFLLANFSLYRKLLETSIATEQRSIDATLSLLADEITQNLEAFKTYWGKVTQLSESSNDPTQKHLALARQAIELNLPAWSFTIWETQMALLTKALSSEELQQAQTIYSQLKEVSAIYSKLQSLVEEQQANLRADRWPDGGPILMGVTGPPRKFDRNAPVLWESLEQIAHTLTAQSNPLKQKNHQNAA